MLPINSNDAITFSQSSEGVASWCESNKFVYDVAYPSSVDSNEIADVMGEVFTDDAYRLQSITHHGDVWVDIGCHVGLFSIAAIQAGAHVGVMVDMDAERLVLADSNVRLFRDQSIARRLQSVWCSYPHASVEEISNVDQLVSLAAECGTDYFPDKTRTCLKLDIQGYEKTIFSDINIKNLSKHYQMMVFEYHFEDLDDMALNLERAGWSIEKIKRHNDVLLGIDTYLVWAVSG